MLSLTPNFKMSDIEKDFAAFEEDIKQHLTEAFSKTLVDLVDRARSKTKAEEGFNNITWNLRASIGGVIVRDHGIVFTYFPPIKDGGEGRKTGLALAKEVALLSDDGEITLVFVAGMEYAAFVEAKGWDVITHTNNAYMEEFLKNNLK
jgi:hypothetical protein